MTEAFAEVSLLWPELKPYMDDPDVERIHINPDQTVWMKRAGAEVSIQIVKEFFANDRLVRDLKAMSEILNDQPLNAANPIFEVNFADGSYIAAVIPPASVHGVTLTLSRIPFEPLA